MEVIANRFAALDMDSIDEGSVRSSKTPTFEPTPLTTAEVSYVRKLDSEMKNTRFRSWAQEETTSNNRFGTVPGKERETTWSRKTSSQRSGYQPQHKPRPINSTSVVDFPSLGAPAKVSSGASKTWGDSFAKKVADLAERERQAEEEQRYREEVERRQRMSDMHSIPIFASRFRRTLEDILAEEDAYDGHQDEDAFPDDDYEPSGMNDSYAQEDDHYDDDN